eukprot:5441448-Pyramimonas_sp.AAC.2
MARHALVKIRIRIRIHARHALIRSAVILGGQFTAVLINAVAFWSAYMLMTEMGYSTLGAGVIHSRTVARTCANEQHYYYYTL